VSHVTVVFDKYISNNMHVSGMRENAVYRNKKEKKHKKDINT